VSSKKRIVQLVVVLMLVTMASAVAAQEVSYKVKPGDTLAQIAEFYGISQEAILVRNNLIDPNRLRYGMTLIIPTGPIAMPATHTVKPGERLIDVAIRYNTTVEALQQANNIVNANLVTTGTVLKLPAVGGPLPASTSGQGGANLPAVIPGPANFERLHTVDVGQDLRYIAALYGVTWQSIAARNSLPNANYIQAGMQLIIPAVNPPFGTGGPNVTPTPQPNSPVVVAPVVPRRTVNGYYTVQAGDNLFAIASDLGVNIYTVAQANGLLNLNAIYTGQLLLVPGAVR
jgi:LysM repeat protein